MEDDELTTLLKSWAKRNRVPIAVGAGAFVLGAVCYHKATFYMGYAIVKAMPFNDDAGRAVFKTITGKLITPSIAMAIIETAVE